MKFIYMVNYFCYSFKCSVAVPISKKKGRIAMLKEKLNLKTIYCILNVLAFIMFYIRIDIQLIDVLYLIFVLFFIVKYICEEVFQ